MVLEVVAATFKDGVFTPDCCPALSGEHAESAFVVEND